MGRFRIFTRLLCILAVISLIISSQIYTALASEQIIKLDAAFSSYSANLYDTAYINYTMSSDEIQIGEPAREIVLALDTTQSMKNKIDENYDYTSWRNYSMISLSETPSANGFYMEGNVIKIYGNWHSNNNLFLQCGNIGLYDESSTASNLINGTVEVSGSSIEWPYYSEYNTTLTNPVHKVTGAPKMRFPDISDAVKNDPDIVMYNSSQTFSGDNFTFDKSIYVNGSLNINAQSLNANGLLAARDNLIIRVSDASVFGSFCLYSETGNVEVHIDVGEFRGVIAAPRGTVKIEGTSPVYRGRIIGNTIDSRSANLSVDSRGIEAYEQPIMEYIEKTTRLYKEKQIVKNFIDSYSGSPHTKIGVISYAEKAEIVSELVSTSDTGNVNLMKSSIDMLQPSDEIITHPDGTYLRSRRNIGDAMRRAYYMLKGSPDTNATKYIVVLTDGISNVWTKVSSSDSTYETGSGDSIYQGWNDTDAGEGYAKTIGTLINNANYKPFFIALPGVALLSTTERSEAEAQLAAIAGSGGASTTPNGNLFYSTSTEADITSAFNNVAANIPEPSDFPSELPFQSVTFTQTFPQEVKVLSAEYSGNSLTVSKSGNQYTVTGNLSGLKLVKNTYTGRYRLATAPNILVKVRYTSIPDTVVVLPNGVLSSSIILQGGTLNYRDYFGNTGSISSPDHSVNLKFFVDIG